MAVTPLTLPIAVFTPLTQLWQQRWTSLSLTEVSAPRTASARLNAARGVVKKSFMMRCDFGCVNVFPFARGESIGIGAQIRRGIPVRKTNRVARRDRELPHELFGE